MHTLLCEAGESCSYTVSMGVSVSTSLTNEEHTTITNSYGESLSVTAGVMFIGPTFTVTGTLSKDWSEAVGSSFSMTDSETTSKDVSMSIGARAGTRFWGKCHAPSTYKYSSPMH